MICVGLTVNPRKGVSHLLAVDTHWNDEFVFEVCMNVFSGATLSHHEDVNELAVDTHWNDSFVFEVCVNVFTGATLSHHEDVNELDYATGRRSCRCVRH